MEAGILWGASRGLLYPVGGSMTAVTTASTEVSYNTSSNGAICRGSRRRSVGAKYARGNPEEDIHAYNERTKNGRNPDGEPRSHGSRIGSLRANPPRGTVSADGASLDASWGAAGTQAGWPMMAGERAAEGRPWRRARRCRPSAPCQAPRFPTAFGWGRCALRGCNLGCLTTTAATATGPAINITATRAARIRDALHQGQLQDVCLSDDGLRRWRAASRALSLLQWP